MILLIVFILLNAIIIFLKIEDAKKSLEDLYFSDLLENRSWTSTHKRLFSSWRNDIYIVENLTPFSTFSNCPEYLKLKIRKERKDLY